MLLFFRGAGRAKYVVHSALAVGGADAARLVGPEPQSQSALGGVIDVSMQDEGVDSLLPRNGLLGKSECSRLFAFGSGSVGTVKTLFRQDDAPRLPVPLQRIIGQVVRQDLQVAE